MPFTYQIHCTNHCGRPAEYKVASRWTNGMTEELKTYGLLCKDCLAPVYLASLTKNEKCRLTPNETLESPGIFQLNHEQRDAQLVRLTELESKLQREATN